MAEGERITVEVSLNIPPGSDLAEGLRWLFSLPSWDPDRHECEAFLWMTLARSAWRDADRLRALQRRKGRRR